MADTDPTHRRILEDAIRMELEGVDLFERASDVVKHPRAKEMFIGLAKQEHRHAEILNHQLESMSASQRWSSLEEAKRSESTSAGSSVFREMRTDQTPIAPDAGELEVLELGMAVEKRSIEYYADASSKATDPNARETFDWLVEEEEGHLVMLKAEFDNRSGSGFYYDTREFSLEV